MTTIRLTLFGRTFEFCMWREITAYTAEEDGEKVFVREQYHRFLPYRRVITHRPPDDG